jgi:hypothetical protein
LTSTRLPEDFDAATYLSLHPDVAAAGMDPAEHYRRHGAAEGRPYKPSEHEAEFVTAAPSNQAVADLFAGEWSSAFPPEMGIATAPGHARLFEDARIRWMESTLGPVQGMDVLEIGPLEAAHSYMLQELGAASVLAIESNRRAFLKCLCVKEIMNLDRVRFLLGDAVAWLEQEARTYDLLVASGILYHMAEPLRFLDAVTARSDRVFLWTHHYDETVISRREDSRQFAPAGRLRPDADWQGSKRLYPGDATAWKGFSGGRHPFAIWLTRDTILGYLEARGFTILGVEFDHRDHPNGPALALAARRG